MLAVGVFEAENRLMALLDEVEESKEVLITRRGRPVARLIPAEAEFDRAKARRAADGLRLASKGQTLAPPPGLFLKELPISIDDETAERVWQSTSQLAEVHRLTAYDAAYLELAMRLGLPLATADKSLIAAARRADVALLSAV